MANIEQIPVVHFDELEHSEDMAANGMDGFDKVSYGDAEYTLVSKDELISELMRWNDDGRYSALIGELMAVPDDVLIALEG